MCYLTNMFYIPKAEGYLVRYRFGDPESCVALARRSDDFSVMFILILTGGLIGP